MTTLQVLNTQPAEKPDRRDDGSLDVHSIFYTLQGEGPFAGRPAVFVRLAGCDLQCPGCDTEYTQGRIRYIPSGLITEVNGRWIPGWCGGPWGSARLVVITGGEPFRQGIGRFVNKLLEWGYAVQIETNGTLDVDDRFPADDRITVVCSPKTPRIHRGLYCWIDAYKYVLTAGQVDPTDGLPTSALGMPKPPARPHTGFQGEVYVQPCDEKDSAKNHTNLRACVDSCLRFGYRLTTQLHKDCNLP